MKKSIVLLLLLFSFTAFSNTLPPDSIGVEKNGNNVIVLHKVDAKETLYGISRRYKVSVDDIKVLNPGIEKGISVGQIVKIPFKGTFVTEKTEKKAFDFSEPEKPKKTTAVVASTPVATGTTKTHKVGPKETLFSIAKQYNVSVDDVKKWNNLTINELKLDQELIVSNPGSGATTSETAKAQTPTKDTKPTVVAENKQVVTQMGGYEKITMKGSAETMSENHDQTKYLCLHKTANLGTIIQVKNEANGNTVFARVIGKLPDVAENNGIIIKISVKSAERLGVETKQYPVEISYIP